MSCKDYYNSNREGKKHNSNRLLLFDVVIILRERCEDHDLFFSLGGHTLG